MAMLVAVGFLFVDLSGRVPSAWFKSLTWLQLIPSLLQFSQTLQHGLAVTAYGFVVILLLTLVFGRVYCSYLCPLGAFKDLLSWFSASVRSWRNKRLRFRFAPPQTKLRYSILLVVCFSLGSGSLFLVSLLDPYSNFGRFFSDLFRPLYMLCNNGLSRLLEAFGSYALYPVTVAKTNPWALVFPAAMLAVVVWLAVQRGRLYCNTVCPVGTLLGLISKASLYKIRFNATACNRCGNCVFVCKAQCIDVKNKEVDFSRCVGCGNCLKACDKSGIRYSLARKTKRPEELETTQTPAVAPQALAGHSPAADISKRRFVWGGALCMAAFGRLSAAEDSKKGSSRTAVLASHVATPPGSLALEHFMGSCTACHLCVSACPSGVLKPSFLEYGFWGMLLPFMDFGTSFCNYECTRCTEVCPNGAILPLSVEKKRLTQIGIVRFEKENCVVVTEGTSCGACSEHCPTKAVSMVPYEGELTLPETNPDICIGCGACEHACPVTPYKAIVVDGLLRHQEAQKPKEEELEEKPLEAFPF